FGPARYTVFVAPAFLVLVAVGLTSSPAWARYPLALALAVASLAALPSLVYDPELKADWRDFASELAAMPTRGPIVVVVGSADPARNVEVETARYYLPADCRAIASTDATEQRLAALEASEVYWTVPCRGGKALGSIPESVGTYHFGEAGRYPGLI